MPTVLHHCFIGTLKKEKSGHEMPPFKVQISSQLECQISECLDELQLSPVEVKMEITDQPVSLITKDILDDFHPAIPTEAGVVPWSPPQPNWNCWTGCNIDEG